MLAPKYWISFLLALLFVDTSDGSRDKAPKGPSHCSITSPFNSSYVKAHLMKYTPGRGCYSNATTSKRQEVHVINVDINLPGHDKRTQVNLRVEPRNLQHSDAAKEYQHPLVFVLYSEAAVKWKVELVGITTTTPKHLFLVPEHSRVRFKQSKFRKFVKSRVVSLPESATPQELVDWTRLRYKAVTSYNEVEGPNLLLEVGLVPKAGEDCDVTNLIESPNAAKSTIQIQPTDGCVSEGKKIIPARPVYIIELGEYPPNTFGMKDHLMELEVTSTNNEPINKDFYLIIKSPLSLKWAVRSRKVQGWIDIVTDADVDLKGIRMHTVALRRETMKSTGAELIKWAEYYIGSVEAYTYVQQANRIRLLLHPAKRNQFNLPDHPKVPEEAHDVTDQLRQTIITTCREGSMEISIPSYFFRDSGIVKEQITLLDPMCRAIENNTHIILKTSLSSCNTKFLQVDDRKEFSNAIVIRASGVADTLIDEFGSAFLDSTEMSGSGSHDLTEGTYVDDEDFQYHSVEIDIKCSVPQGHVVIEASGPSQGLDYQLQLYQDHYQRPYDNNSPITVARDSRLYVQASILSNEHLNVNVENCWLSPQPVSTDHDMSKIFLIRQGCPLETSVEWHNSPSSPDDSQKWQSRSRFSFQIEDYFKHHNLNYLHCELTICLKTALSQTSSIPRCPREGEKCDHVHKSVSHFIPRSREIGSEILVAGPWRITDKEIRLGNGGMGGQDDVTSGRTDTTMEGSSQTEQIVTIEGLDSGTVVAIAFAAFAIGILLTGALWFIHTHTGPRKRGAGFQESAETSGETTPNSSSPISA